MYLYLTDRLLATKTKRTERIVTSIKRSKVAGHYDSYATGQELTSLIQKRKIQASDTIVAIGGPKSLSAVINAATKDGLHPSFGYIPTGKETVSQELLGFTGWRAAIKTLEHRRKQDFYPLALGDEVAIWPAQYKMTSAAGSTGGQIQIDQKLMLSLPAKPLLLHLFPLTEENNTQKSNGRFMLELHELTKAGLRTNSHHHVLARLKINHATLTGVALYSVDAGSTISKPGNSAAMAKLPKTDITIAETPISLVVGRTTHHL